MLIIYFSAMHVNQIVFFALRGLALCYLGRFPRIGKDFCAIIAENTARHMRCERTAAPELLSNFRSSCKVSRELHCVSGWVDEKLYDFTQILAVSVFPFGDYNILLVFPAKKLRRLLHTVIEKQPSHIG